MRVPRPAASTMARLGELIVIFFFRSLRRRHVCVVPRLEVVERRMDQRTAQIAPDARQMTQVLRLAVAPVEAGGKSGGLGWILGARGHLKPHEGGRGGNPFGGQAR